MQRNEEGLSSTANETFLLSQLVRLKGEKIFPGRGKTVYYEMSHINLMFVIR